MVFKLFLIAPVIRNEKSFWGYDKGTNLTAVNRPYNYLK